MDIIGLIKQHLGSAELSKLANMAGISGDKVNGLVGSLLPLLLSQISKVLSGSGEGAKRILDTLNDPKLAKAGSESSSGNIPQLPGLDLGSLFGGSSAMNSVLATISKMTGVSSESITKLLSGLLPIIMSVLASQKQKMGVDSAGFTSMLASQTNKFQSAMPKELAGALGSISGVADQTRGMARQASQSIPEPPKVGNPILWAVPLLIVGGIGAYLYAQLNNAPPPAKKDIPVKPVTKDDGGTKTSDVAKGGDKLGAMAKANSQGMINTGMKKAEAGIKDLFSNLTKTLADVKDGPTAEAAAKKIGELSAGVDATVETMKRLPSDPREALLKLVKEQQGVLKPTLDKLFSDSAISAKLKGLIEGLFKKFDIFTQD